MAEWTRECCGDPEEKILLGRCVGVRKNLFRKVFLGLIKIGFEFWLYHFCATGMNSLILSYLALIPLTGLSRE